MYYDYPDRRIEILKTGLIDIIPPFESYRMAKRHYVKRYNWFNPGLVITGIGYKLVLVSIAGYQQVSLIL